MRVQSGAEPFFFASHFTAPFTSPRCKPCPAWVYSAFIVIIHRNNQKKRIFIPDPMMQCVPPMMKKVLISLR
ncbi:hypothetical protein CW300_25765 [Serratia marcescens]|nr:hypothetical protein CW300_25765 [Serratia marcescens]PYA30909.1 hypothetical protein DMW50_23440 [Serratia marcescens]PYA33747.1 hypothetical protein DMW44_26585 [Serratia marcescens]PYA34237.1 hypothetical protein DMW47_23275 [Serratia marcescens]PYB01783.1 hypothetical protein DMW58_23555 [Serratia marcescens]